MKRYMILAAGALLTLGTSWGQAQIYPPQQEARPVNPEVAQMDAYYRRYLGRPVDEGGLGWGIPALRRGQNVPKLLMASEEYYQRQKSTPSGLVQGLFADVAQRNPTQREIDTWVNRYYQLNGDRTQLVDEFVAAATGEAAPMVNPPAPVVVQPQVLPDYVPFVPDYYYRPSVSIRVPYLGGYLHSGRYFYGRDDHRGRDEHRRR